MTSFDSLLALPHAVSGGGGGWHQAPTVPQKNLLCCGMLRHASKPPPTGPKIRCCGILRHAAACFNRWCLDGIPVREVGRGKRRSQWANLFGAPPVLPLKPIPGLAPPTPSLFSDHHLPPTVSALSGNATRPRGSSRRRAGSARARGGPRTPDCSNNWPPSSSAG